jgi:transposase-like protein
VPHSLGTSVQSVIPTEAQQYRPGRSRRSAESSAGRCFSASAISEINKKLDNELGCFARRELDSEYPYLIIDARYEKLRENGVIRSRAVLVAIGKDWEGQRQVLGVEMANRESATSWKDFLLGLKRRGLRGVVFAVSDDHPELKRAIMEVLREANWQRCYVHFLRNALDHLPRKVSDDCLVELRWLYDRRNAEERF